MTGEPRSPRVAGLLSLALPGLGHTYNGEPVRGLLAFLSAPALFVLGNILFFSTFRGMVAVLALVVLLYLGIAAHAVLRARRLIAAPSQAPRRWTIYLLIAVGVSLLGGPIFARALLPILRYRTFRTPAASMEPTLRAGDHFMVDTWAYRKQPPQRGDVVVFHAPTDPGRDLVKRCVAVSGDSVEIRDKRLSVHGKPVDEPYATFLDPDVLRADDTSPMAARDQLSLRTISAGSLFVLGDNRDNSYDSRFFGDVQQDLLEAKVLYIYWAPDRTRIGRPVG